MDLQFHPLWQPGGRGESGETHGLGGVHGAAGVGQEEVAFGVDILQDIGEGVFFCVEIGSAEGDGDDFRAACCEGVLHAFEGGKFAGSKEEP